jgi:hypothetical protein
VGNIAEFDFRVGLFAEFGHGEWKGGNGKWKMENAHPGRRLRAGRGE